ncbi:MAG TPA: nucleoside hydrolase [Bacteroidales bacterium]|jgi:inosine-uridine nucleoside N-ribohydrolase|nr:nucleoside hydrolase [Bacteroidales bacterium]
MYRRNFIKNSGLAIAGMGLSAIAQGSPDDEIKKQNKPMANDSLKEKLLLDTDIGSDIDDSLCLAYLLCQKQCEILGITTVSGDSVNRAKLASALLKAAGSNGIPIYPGVEQPLLNPQKQPVAHQVRYLSKWPHETKFPKGQAIEFMRRTIRENPNEITLLAIGPLTNIALLFAVDPEIPALLKRLVMMCGVFTYRYQGDSCLSEWNARCDPHATAMVYNAPVKNIVSVGLDVTGQVIMEKDEIINRFNTDLLKVVLDFSGILDNTRKSIVYHDPLAGAVIFKREICDFKRGNVEVEIGNNRLEGLTYWKEDQNGKNDVAFGVNKEMFLDHFFGTITK